MNVLVTETAATCRLCGERRKLCLSHIVPEFCFKPLYDPKYVLIRQTADGRSSKLQKGLRERLLCEMCEGWINDHYEKP